MTTLEQALSETASARLLSTIGYAPAEVEDLHGSGIAALDLAEISEENAFEILGSNPVNVFSPDADWMEWREKAAPERAVLIDFYSGSVFRPLELTRFALFGQTSLRPPIPENLPRISSNYRWRFNSVPVLEANTSQDLNLIAAKLKDEVREGHAIFFRGQTVQYSIPRRLRTRELLYGSEDVSEPSMLSTAFRERFPYVSAERHWRSIIADIDYRITGSADNRWYVEDKFETLYIGKDAEIARWHSLSTMAITQHYGLPTYGLDVTSSIEVAWWFATNKYGTQNNVSLFSPHVWGGGDTRKWPAIYVLRSGSGEYIGNLGLPALRPERQHAVFAKGGWGPHGNICADDLIAIIVLAPTVGPAPGETSELFPGACEDHMYAELTNLKKRLTSRHPLYVAAGLQYVHVFEQ